MKDPTVLLGRPESKRLLRMAAGVGAAVKLLMQGLDDGPHGSPHDGALRKRAGAVVLRCFLLQHAISDNTECTACKGVGLTSDESAACESCIGWGRVGKLPAPLLEDIAREPPEPPKWKVPNRSYSCPFCEVQAKPARIARHIRFKHTFAKTTPM